MIRMPASLALIVLRAIQPTAGLRPPLTITAPPSHWTASIHQLHAVNVIQISCSKARRLTVPHVTATQTRMAARLAISVQTVIQRADGNRAALITTIPSSN